MKTDQEIKDLIAHFGFWEGRIVTLYGQLSRDEEPAANEPALDELNAQAYQQNLARTLDEVRREERTAYTQLMAVTVNAADDDLFNPQHFVRSSNYEVMDSWNTSHTQCD